MKNFTLVTIFFRKYRIFFSFNNANGLQYFYRSSLSNYRAEHYWVKHHLEECLRFIPNHGAAWRNLWSIYLKQGKVKEEKKFKEVLASCEDKNIRCDILIQRGTFCSEQQRFREAEKKFNQSLSLEPLSEEKTALIHYALGSLYERKGDLDKAKEKFEKLLKSSVKDDFLGGTHFHLGCIYQRMEDREKAKHHFKECLKFRVFRGV